MKAGPIAGKNGLSGLKRSGGRGRRFQMLAGRVRRVFTKVSLDPKELGVVNVYDAIMASAYIYKFLLNGFWGGKLDLFLINSRRAFLKIKAMVFRG